MRKPLFRLIQLYVIVELELIKGRGGGGDQCLKNLEIDQLKYFDVKFDVVCCISRQREYRVN